MTVTAFENLSDYLIIVTDGTDTFEYRWGKTPPEGWTIESYLQSCKREALLLAENEIAKKQPPQEIVI